MTRSVKKVLTSECRVQFSDCDSFGHLNNAAYLNYFMNSREEQVLEEYGLSFPDIFRRYDAAWFVSETRISYLYPAKYGDVIKIITRVTQVRNSSSITEHIMLNCSEEVVHAVAAINVVWVDGKHGRPSLHPHDIQEFLDSVNTGLSDGFKNFDERVRLIKNDYKRMHG